MQLPQGRREGQKRSPREGLRSMAGTQPLPSFTEAGTQILESEVPCLSHRVVSGREDSQATWLQLRVFSSPPSLSPRQHGLGSRRLYDEGVVTNGSSLKSDPQAEASKGSLTLSRDPRS